ncbi:hypothetical protein ACFQ9X_36955 [Catenulispora yoronensis]
MRPPDDPRADGDRPVRLHHLFGFAQQLAADATPMAMAMPARGYWWCGHDEPSGVAQAMAHVAGMPPSQHSMTVGMWAAHAGAALAAAWWLRRGEAAVWSLGRALALALITPLVLLAAALVPGCWTPPRRPRPPSPAPTGSSDRAAFCASTWPGAGRR